MAYENPNLQVTVVDRDASRIAAWKSAHLPLYEPGLHEILRIARDGSKAISFTNSPDPIAPTSAASASSASSECDCSHAPEEIHVKARQPNLFFSTEISRCISEADIILIAVNTPTKTRGIGAGRATDTTALEAVTREIALHAQPGAILVEKSTVPCRTADLIRATVQIHRPGMHFEVLSCPEFLSAGTAISDLLKPSRVLIGSEPTPSGRRAAAALASVYSWVPSSAIISTNVYSSELAKLVANAMLAQRISSINSISAICEKVGADVDELSAAVGADSRIGAKYLKAGVGFGGSCFGKDIRSLVYLAEGLGLHEVAEYWQQVLALNTYQMTRFARRIVQRLNGSLVGKKIAVLGYAFKKGTDDTRESPALETIKVLLEDGPRRISVFDPFCEPAVVREEIGRLVGGEVLRENGGCVEVLGDGYEACSGAAAVVVMTDCDEFTNSSFPRENRQPQPKVPTSTDLRPPPFSRAELTEGELLAVGLGLGRIAHERYVAEPICAKGCTKCTEGSGSDAVREGTSTRGKGEKLDWARIAYHLEMPKWVFDGRGVLDGRVMEGLGCRVEGVGRVGWGGL